MDDLDAVRETLNGNTEAFSVLVERYSPVLYRLAFRMSDQEDPSAGEREAEEAVQEIFLRAYRGLDKFNIRYRFYTWLYSIALNYLRSARRKKRISRLFTVVPYNEALHSSGYGNPEAASIQKEGERLAREALKKLKHREREVFILRILEEHSVGETAKILGIPEGTVKVRLHRAKKELAAIMKMWQWEEDEGK